MTSAYRLLEALDLFRDDFRIRFVFTVNDTSAFSPGVHDVLKNAGTRTVSWSTVAEGGLDYDLVLSASENIDFDQVQAHTIVLPHGLGFNKYVPDSNGQGWRLAGLPPEGVLDAGRATIVLSHPEQRDQLLRACPSSAGQTAVVGDIGFDRLWASRNLRSRYRAELHTRDRTLVTLTSTWRQDSLLGRWHHLPLRLIGELPADSYQVCLVLHPNIWSFYGAHQISLWLSTALDAGLVLMPPESGWQAALIAADQVIVDHGSLGLMAAALDKPLLTNATSNETVPGSPPDALARAAPPLSPDTPLRDQLDRARNTYQPGQFASIVSRSFAPSGMAETNLRDLVYAKLELPPRESARSLHRIPVPAPIRRSVTSYVVRTVPAEGDELTLTRYPAAAWRDEDVDETHVVADEAEPDLTILERAAVIIHDQPLDPATAHDWVLSTLTAYPGSRVAISAVPGGHWAAVRNFGTVRIIAPTYRADDVSMVGSAIYCCVLSQAVDARTLLVQAGARRIRISLQIIAAGAGPAEH